MIYRIFFFLLMISVSVNGLLSIEVNKLIAEGDRLYLERSDLQKAYHALEKYREVLKKEPRSYEALWKISKTAFYLAEMLTSKKAKWEVVEEGVDCAKKAIKVNPKGVDGHFWLGVNYTKVGEVKGVIKSLFLIGPIKRAMRRVIETDNTYEGGGAYTVLGRVYSQVPGIFGGSDKKALKNYERARAICPTSTLNLLFLAETLWDLDRKGLALKTLQQLLEMEPDERWKAEAKKHKLEAKKLLNKYKKK